MPNTTVPVPRRAPVTLARARRALREGSALVLPNESPLTHVVTATRARTVNEAKGRPSDRPVALWARHPDTLATLGRLWDLGPEAAETARWMLTAERLTVLLPLRDTALRPPWLAPAVKDGWMLLFGARSRPLRPLLDEHPVRYVSSANRTGRPPAATAEDALRMFPPGVEVLHLPDAGPDSAVLEDPPPRRATTTVRLHPDGRLELHRHGAQDQHATGPEDYLRHLRERCPAVRG